MDNISVQDALGLAHNVRTTDNSGVHTPHQILDSPGPGATATEVASGTGGAQGVAAAVGLRLLGFSVRENATPADVAEVLLRHGTSGTAPLLAAIELAADQSVNAWFGPTGILCPNGIYVDRTAGETHLVLYTEVL